MFEQPTVPESPKSRQEVLRERGIVSFDVEYTSEEREAVERMEIGKALEDFDYYGAGTIEDIASALEKYLGQLEGNTPETVRSISQLIAKVTEGETRGLNGPAIWLTVRVSTPNTDFDTPRWHRDGHPFREEDGQTVSGGYKLVFVIKGAKTRFAEIMDEDLFRRCEEEESENYELHKFADDNEETYKREGLEIRKKKMEAVQETFPAKEGQATIFRIGGGNAKPHSEPPIEEPRIFLSVVVGSMAQVEEFKNRRSD